jgi:hypothetical protein
VKKSIVPAGLRLSPLILLAWSLVGCESMTAMRQDVATFGQGVHSASDAQLSFYASGRNLECDADFYSKAIDWSRGHTNMLPSFTDCSPKVLDDQEYAKRRAQLNALTLYADKLQAITGPANDNPIGDAEKDLATQVNSAAKAAGHGANLSVVGTVEGAIVAITGFVLDQKRFHDAKTAAQGLDQQIALVVDTLKLENHDYAASLKIDLSQTHLGLRAALVAARADHGPMDSSTAAGRKPEHHAAADETANGTLDFLDVVRSRQLLRAASPFGADKNADIASTQDPVIVQKLNATLDGVKQANHAIANAPRETIVAAVKDLVSRAKQAKSDQEALSK